MTNAYDMVHTFALNDVVFFIENTKEVKGIITRLESNIARVKTEEGKKRDRHISKLRPACDASTNRIQKPTFSIAERFEFLSTTVAMVGQKQAAACIILGQGGLGKTHTVKSTLLDLKLNFKLIKGNSTAKGLFDALKEYNGEVIVFDDCDAVLEDRVSRSILKGALDSYDQREISWFNGEGLETLGFSGYVIFISNKQLENIDQALRTRCMVIDVTMTIPEILERMESLLPHISPEIDMDVKISALNLITKYAYNSSNLSLRTLKSVIACANNKSPNWERLALYHMTN